MIEYTYTADVIETRRLCEEKPGTLHVNLIESKTETHGNPDGSTTTTEYPDRIIASFSHTTEVDQ